MGWAGGLGCWGGGFGWIGVCWVRLGRAGMSERGLRLRVNV